MKKHSLFIADLHLSKQHPQRIQGFLTFLKTRANQAEAVYILGDLFDVWVGDDHNSSLNKTLKTAFKTLTDATPVFLQQGNRDFLIGKQFCDETGLQALEDYTVINLYGTKTLLMHGDLLCSDDIAYQQFRQKSHTPEWQQNILNKPLNLRLLMARWYRLRSLFHQRKKSTEIMDVNQATLENTLNQYQVTRLIHGHTHRPAVHDFTLNKTATQRFVLDQWHNDSASILCWTAEGYKIETLYF